jgi:hypothetical protein
MVPVPVPRGWYTRFLTSKVPYRSRSRRCDGDVKLKRKEARTSHPLSASPFPAKNPRVKSMRDDNETTARWESGNYWRLT